MNTLKNIGQGCLTIILIFLALIVFTIIQGAADLLLALPFYILFKLLEFMSQLPYWLYGILAVIAVLVIRNYNINKRNNP
jgi:hypothetical protein